MSLKLRFLSRARLWSEVVVSSGERVFVPTTSAFTVGAPVALELECSELGAPIPVSGVVQELRALTSSSAAGVLVKLDAASVEKCRALVGDHDDAARVAGRSEPRFDCDLRAKVLSPDPMESCSVKSLSVHGLTLHTPQPVAQGAHLLVAVQLPEGSELLLSTEAMWSRSELSLSGHRLLNLSIDAELRLRIAAETLSQATLRAERYTVLVADDDPSILDFTSRVVTKAGHRVLRAERGDTALELARKERPTLALLDVLMPGLDGHEVCRAIRKDATLSKMPVILLSAMGEDRLAAAAKDAGANGYLTKPMRLEALRAVLTAHLHA